MSNTPFKLRSQGSSFKMMGSSPAKHPLEEKHTHSKAKEKTEVKMDVMDPDVRNIIKKRKYSGEGPQESKESQQREIDELVEKRDPKRKVFPTIEEKKKKEKRNNRGETKKEELERIAQDKITDRLIRESNQKDFLDKQKKDNDRQIKREKEQEKRQNKSKKDKKTEKSISEKIINTFSPHTWFSD